MGSVPQKDSKASVAPERWRHIFWFKGLRSEGTAPHPEGNEAQLPDIRQVRKACSVLLDEVARERGDKVGYELSLLVVEDAEIRALNREHRGLDSSTDVLSFPLLDEAPQVFGAAERADAPTGAAAAGEHFPAEETPNSAGNGSAEFIPAFWVPGPIPIGDVVIARAICQSQAAVVGHAVRDEFWRLLVHGLLHLFGYDHEVSAIEEQRMQKREDELLDILAHVKL